MRDVMNKICIILHINILQLLLTMARELLYGFVSGLQGPLQTRRKSQWCLLTVAFRGVFYTPFQTNRSLTM